MQVTNQRLIRDLSEQEYFALPGFSFSTLKNKGRVIETTEKMTLGKDIHSLLLTPETFSHENKNRAKIRACAIAVKSVLGPLIDQLEKEIVVTADFEIDGYTMPYKGRIDLCIPGRVVIDVKITDGKLEDLVKYFLYDEQLTGYSRAIKARTAILIGCSPKRKYETRLVAINIENINWWRNQILINGKQA